MLHDRQWDHNWTQAIQHLPALEQLIEREPVMVSPQTLLHDAIAQMNQSVAFADGDQGDASSCILVMENAQLVGILTERDIVRLVTVGIDVHHTPIAEMMTQPVITLTLAESSTVYNALSILAERRIRHLPIVGEQGEIQGLVTQTDLLRIFDPVEIATILAAMQRRIDVQTKELSHLTQKLQQEIVQHQQTEAALETSQRELMQAYGELEQRVIDRTQALQYTNELLHHSEQKLRAIFDGTFEFMGMLTIEGIVIEANRAAMSVINAEFTDVVGKPFWLTPWWEHFPEQQERLRQAIMQAAQGKFIRFESQHIWADGSQAFVDFSLQPVFDATGKVILLIPEGRDITEKKQLEAKFLRAQRLENLGMLAGGIAHDLNNLLTPILATAQILPRKLPPLDAKSKELLQLLENTARKAAALVQQILAFARGVEGKRMPVPIRYILNDVRQIIRQTFPRSIDLEVTIEPDVASVLADATQLHQVFMNLCVNARDAMPNGGLLSITADNILVDQNFAQMQQNAQPGQYIVVTIVDNGTGIPPDLRDRIFEPFFTTKAIGEGTGLGLSTVASIIQNHGGFLQLSSEVGQGSCFRIYLPSCEQSAPPVAALPESPTGQGELILVVDDELAICDIIRTTLETYNYQVTTANDGISTLAIYAQRQGEIRAVLIDLDMPQMDGYTTIATLQRINPQIKVIAMSGSTFQRKPLGAPHLNIKKMLAKPFTSQELLNILHDILVE